MNNKKAGGFYTLWVEIIALFLLIVGFLISFTTIGSTFISYIVIFLWGMMFGRLWYRLKGHFKFPFFIIIVGFLIGYILATMIHHYGSPLLITATYLVGIILSNWLHNSQNFNEVDY